MSINLHSRVAFYDKHLKFVVRNPDERRRIALKAALDDEDLSISDKVIAALMEISGAKDADGATQWLRDNAELVKRVCDANAKK